MTDWPENYDVHPAPVEDPPDPERLFEPSRLREVLGRDEGPVVTPGWEWP